VVCGDRATDFAAVASTYRIAKSANAIWKTIASMKYSVKYARYIYKSYTTLPSHIFYIPVQIIII